MDEPVTGHLHDDTAGRTFCGALITGGMVLFNALPEAQNATGFQLCAACERAARARATER